MSGKSPKSKSQEGAGEELSAEQIGGLKAAILNSPEAMAMMQNKLSGMCGQLSGYYDTLPKVVKRRVKALKKLQVENLKLEAELSKEIHELECKYMNLAEPLFKKRSEIVSGQVEPTDEECDFPSEDEEEEEGEDQDGEKKKEKGINGKDSKAKGDEVKKEDKKEEEEKDENAVGIPSFWLTIFKNIELIGENIQDHDEAILEHLIDVKVRMIEKPMGFAIDFHFSPNEHFSNEVLTKTYDMKSEVDGDDPFSFEGAEITSCKGCSINWKKGKNVTVRTVQKKQKHKQKGNTRMVAKEVTADSFFNFFAPPTIPEDEEDMDPETRELLQSDFEIGETIRQRLVQRAVLYFTGEALDDGDEYESDEEDEEDDEEDSEDDEDYEPKEKAGRGGRRH